MYDLTGRVGVVTGCAGKNGFGQAIAIRLATEGADVVVVDKFNILPRDKELHPDWKGLEAVVAEIRAVGRKVLAITCDTTKSEEVDIIVKDVIGKFGQIDILVNNAGVQVLGDIDNISNEIWDINLSVNLTGTFFCARAIAREMIRRDKGGKIVNIASTNAKAVMSPGRIGYAASKFGVLGLTQSLAIELAPYKINVNAICPGQADTGFHTDQIKSEAQNKGMTENEVRSRLFGRTASMVPLGRLLAPEDIANAVAFLVSREADYITGQSINVNGGILMAH